MPTDTETTTPAITWADAALREWQRRTDPINSTRWPTAGDLAAAVEPGTITTPALTVIHDAIRNVAAGDTDRLIISMPPQEGKSTAVTRFGIEWMLIQNPNLRAGIVSYGDRIAESFSYQIRTDIQTFNGDDDTINLGLRLRRDSTAASRWYLAAPHKGGVYAVGIGGALTSRALDLLVIDDPVKDYRSADSLVQSEQAWLWWQSVARPRLAPGAPVIVVLTRWHENDLAGRLLAKQAQDEKDGLEHYDHWTVINIPALADHDPTAGQTDPLGRDPGQFMTSARGRSQAQWQATKAATSSRIWTALYQGRPSPETGDVWQRVWWRRYSTPIWTARGDGTYWIDEADEIIQSWDMAFKDTKSSDWVVGQILARRGADVYVVDQVHARLSFTATIAAFTRMVTRWPQTTAKLVEDKANGTAVIDSLRKKIPGIIAVNPTESKYSRASAVAPFIEAGNVHLPDAEIALFDPEGLIDEAAMFPNGAHDDQVDALSQALGRMLLRAGQGAVFLAAMKTRAARDGVEVPAAARGWRERLREAKGA